MTAPQAVLVVGGLVLLFAGAITGIFMSVERMNQPTNQKYLRFAHLASYGQAPMLFGLAFALGYSGMSASFDLWTAWVLVAGAGLLVLKDLVNWLTATEDEFVEQGAGFRIAGVFGPVHVIGLVLVSISVVSGL